MSIRLILISIIPSNRILIKRRTTSRQVVVAMVPPIMLQIEVGSGGSGGEGPQPPGRPLRLFIYKMNSENNEFGLLRVWRVSPCPGLAARAGAAGGAGGGEGAAGGGRWVVQRGKRSSARETACLHKGRLPTSPGLSTVLHQLHGERTHCIAGYRLKPVALITALMN